MSTETVPHARGTPWLATASLAMPVLLAALGVSVANIALPGLMSAFAATLPEAQWVVLAYLLAMTLAIVPAGYAGDLFGRRRVLLAGIMLFTLASAACALAPSLPALVAARFVQGMAAAVLSTLSMSLVRDMAGTQSLGAGMGILGSMSAVGTTLGPFLGGVVVSSAGWPAAFAMLVPAGAASFVLAMRVLPRGEPRRSTAGGFDIQGIILFAAALTALALFMTPSAAVSPRHAWLLLAGGVAAGALFVAAERRAPAPFIRLDAIRSRPVASALASNVLVSAVMMSTLVVGPVFLSAGLGFGAAKAGLIMSAGPAASMLSGFAAGRLADRYGTRIMTLAGLAQMVAGALALALLPLALGAAGYVAALIVLAPGYQLYLAANNAAVMAGAEAGERGVVSGLLNLSRNLGFIVGASAAGMAFAAFLPAANAALPASAVATATAMTYLAAGGLAAVALALASA